MAGRRPGISSWGKPSGAPSRVSPQCDLSEAARRGMAGCDSDIHWRSSAPIEGDLAKLMIQTLTSWPVECMDCP